MLASRSLILIILLIIPLALSQTCKNANQDNCGVTGTTCQYYKWFNGTCVFNTCSGQTVYSSSIQNCVDCQGATTSSLCSGCTSIASKYFFDTINSVCTTCTVKYGPLCSTCNSSECLTCTGSNQLNTDKQSCFNGECGKSNCAECLNNSTCKTCSGVFKIFQGSCVCGIQNCQICTKQSCSKCYEGFSISTNKLACNRQCMSNCQICSDLNSCDSCFVGYKYSASTKKCVIDCSGMANCITCSSSTVCSGCASGFQLSIKGTCEAGCSDSNCLTCLTFSQCNQCKTGYRVQNSSCVIDVCTVQYCKKCLDGSKCKECQNFFQLSTDSKKCLPSCGVSKCTVCDSATTCAACQDGFKIQSGTCSPICSISNCAVCQSETLCKTCNGGTVLSDTKTSCIYNCGINGCESCDSSSTCSSCYPGYTANSLRTACIVNCIEGTYLTSSGCASCPANNCKKCDATGKCLRCKNLFYLDSTSFSCIACSTISNCYDCEPGSAKCTTCKNDYENVNGVCVSQANCAVNNCKICVTGSNTKCSNCEDGYSINDAGGCTKISCSGKQFLVGSTCSCGPKTYISGSSCEACADFNCLTCSATVCTSCFKGYYPNGNACTACSSNCVRCDSTGCLECSTDFILKNKLCISPPTSSGAVSVSQTGQAIVCSPGCGKCDIDSNNMNVCVEASKGYVLVKGILHKCDQNCKTCSDGTDSAGLYSICLTCHSGFNLIDGACLKCTGDYATKCRKKDQAYSLTCIPGYTAVNGVCRACASNCVSCQGSGADSCDNGGCVTGFFNSQQFPTCNKCFGGCLICGLNPRQCLKCGDYYYVNSQNTCSKCISNCLSCSTATTCDTCVSGYLKVTSGICKIPSVENCVEYDGELNCLTCDLNYKIQAGICAASIACNTNSTCTTCPYGYYLNTGKCNTCPTLPNCLSCNVALSTACMDCKTGYYLAKGECIKCSITGCLDCSSKFVCTAAATGYFLVSDINGVLTGQASACEGLCSTCTTTSVNCLSCKDGAYAEGNQCVSKNNKDIQFTGYMKALGNSTSESSDYQIGLYIRSLYSIFNDIKTALGYKNFADFLSNVFIKSVGSGSVQLNMIMNSDPTKSDPSVLGTYPFADVVPLKVSSVTNTDTTTNNGVNIPLVLGVSIPLGILLVVIIVIIKVKGSGDDEESGFDGTEKYFQENQEHF